MEKENEPKARKISKAEKLQSEINKIGYIKSYPFFNCLDITFKQRELLELVLSYQDNDKSFFMNYKDIASILGAEKQSITNAVSKLKSKNYISTNVTSNYKGDGLGGGSSSTIFVNIDFIISKVKDILSLNAEKLKVKKEAPKKVKVETKVITPIKEEEVIEEVIEEPIQVVIPKPIVVKKQIINQEDERTLKEIMEDKFKRNFKFPLNSQQREMHVNEFNLLTKNKFQEKMSFPEISELVKTINNKDFDLFWNTIQELKNKIIKNKLETV